MAITAGSQFVLGGLLKKMIYNVKSPLTMKMEKMNIIHNVKYGRIINGFIYIQVIYIILYSFEENESIYNIMYLFFFNIILYMHVQRIQYFMVLSDSRAYTFSDLF